MTDFLVRVVSETYEVVFVGKGYYSLRICFSHWKYMLEDCFDSLSQFALEVVENKMGVDFWHRL